MDIPSDQHGLNNPAEDLNPRTLLYVAAPVDVFFTPSYFSALELSQELRPDLVVFEPATEIASTLDWKARWPDVLSQIALLTLVPRADMTIGAGCWREVSDCRQLHIPVLVYRQEANVLRPLARASLIPSKSRTMTDHATVVSEGI